MTTATSHHPVPDPALFASCQHLADTQLWSLWRAALRSGEQEVLVKVTKTDLPIDRRRLVSILKQSVQLQGLLDRRLVCSPLRADAGDDSITIAYPYLSPQRWGPLTPGLFRAHVHECLVQMTLIIDYLHHFRLVHGDLKLSNFLVSHRHSRLDLRLVDNDFVRREFDSGDAVILGTPSHIAPEILRNEAPAVESDVYSFGRMIETILADDASGGTLKEPVHSQLQGIVDSCSTPELTSRSRSLLTTLQRCGHLSAEKLQLLERQLLRRIIATQTRWIGRAGGKRRHVVRRAISDSRLFGVPESIVDMLSTAVETTPLTAGRTVVRVLNDATLARTPDYWRIDLSDELLSVIYRTVNGQPDWPGRVASVDDGTHVIASIDELARDGDYLPAHLQLSHLLDHTDLAAQLVSDGILSHDRMERWYDIINNARRPDRIADSLLALYDRDELDSQSRLLLGFLLTRCYLFMNRLDDMIALYDSLYPLAVELQDHAIRFRLARHRSFERIARGEHETARRNLEQLMNEAREIGDHEEVGHCLIELAKSAQQADNLVEALRLLDEVQKMLPTGRLAPATTVSMHLCYAMVYFTQGHYHRVTSAIQAALRYSEERRLYLNRPYLHTILALANIRLGRYELAMEQLNKSLADRHNVPGLINLGQYLESLGLLEIARGRLFDARRALLQSRNLFDHLYAWRQGRHWSLELEAASLMGDRQWIELARERARKQMATTSHSVSAVDLEAVEVLDRLHNAGKPATVDDIAVIDRLLQEGHRLIACQILTLFMLHTDRGMRDVAGQRVAALAESDWLATNVPVANILDKLRRNDTDYSDMLKECYVIAGRNGLAATGIALCRRLAEYYRDGSRAKIARRYFEAAARQARAIGNNSLAAHYDAEAEAVPVELSTERLVASIRGMSEILASLEQRSEAAARLIRYAVDLTGAERGVLFVRSGEQLQAAAYISLDHDELKDITDFSHSIVKHSIGQLETVAIDNAVEDDRTNQYSSVIAHNIKAVVCAPITRDDELLGALYLDHHNLPGLFSDDDIRMIESIANFLAVCQSTVDRVNSLVISNDNMRNRLRSAGYDTEFVGQNVQVQEMLSLLPRIAATQSPVLIVGETGTGKECLADMIHRLSPRAHKPLVKLNCAAFAPTLIESELFGVAGGTATGVNAKAGKFEAADGATLFLDEVGDMSLDVQAKVLRVLESQRFERVGSNKSIDTDIRFIYATNRPLDKLVEDGRFRRDLYYRLNTFMIEIPPLRKRPDDIPLLLEHFLGLLDIGGGTVRFSGAAINTLCEYRWPGNVRQLKNFIEMMCVLYPNEVIQPDHIERHLPPVGDPLDEQPVSADDDERDRLLRALTRNKWNQTKAARDLQLPLSTFRNRMKKYGLRRP